MIYTRKTLTFLALIVGILCQTQPDCNDLCYIKQSGYGKCTICYKDCQHSDKASFLSCSILPTLSSESQELTETICKSQCYPEKYPFLAKQNPDQDELPMTLEELEKLKREAEGWSPQHERLLKTFGIMVASSLLFIAVFTKVWRVLDKRKKLKELQQKQQKDWVKCFEKLNSSDTTICSIDSKQITALTNE